MRILYIGDLLVPSSGVSQKMVAQASAWEEHGHQVWLSTATEGDALPARVGSVRERLASGDAGAPARSGSRSLPVRVLRFARRHAGRLLQICRAADALQIELIYTREMARAIGRTRLLTRAPSVVEITSDSVKESTGWLTRMERRQRRESLLRPARGAVCVSHELRRDCVPTEFRSVVIANGCEPVDERLLAARTRPARPTLVYVGSGNHAWGGVDKVVLLAELLPELDFIIIGVDAPTRPNLRVEPSMTRAEADGIVVSATVGIGPLALHRKDMHEASPLKTRQYLSLGLPIIQAYRDTDLERRTRCVLELPNREDNCRSMVAEIRAFANEAFVDRALADEALALATGPLSLAAKEARRLAFFESVSRGD